MSVALEKRVGYAALVAPGSGATKEGPDGWVSARAAPSPHDDRADGTRTAGPRDRGACRPGGAGQGPAGGGRRSAVHRRRPRGGAALGGGRRPPGRALQYGGPRGARVPPWGRAARPIWDGRAGSDPPRVSAVPDRQQDGTATWSLATLQRALHRAPDGLPTVSTWTILQTLWEAGYTWQASRTWCNTGTVVRQRKSGSVTVTDPDTTPKKS